MLFVLLAIVQFEIDEDVVGLVIGKGGSRIKKIEEQYSVTIKVLDGTENSKTRKVVFTKP